MELTPIAQIIGFGVSWWLGLYTINRDLRSVRLRLIGTSLVAYALGLCLELLQAYVSSAVLKLDMVRASGILFLLSPVLWTGAMIYALPQQTSRHTVIINLWRN